MNIPLRRALAALTVALVSFHLARGEPRPVQWRVSDPESARELRNAGAALVADYGGFAVFEADGPVPGGAGVEALPPQHLIHLHAGAIDTTAAATRARRVAVESFSGKRLHLVQWAGPVKPEWVKDLADAGLTLMDYIPENAHLVYGDAAALRGMQARLASKPHVRWEGAFRGADKIHPGARPSASKRAAARAEPDQFAVQLVNDPGANGDTLAMIDALKRAPIVRRRVSGPYLNIVARLPPDAIEELADRPDVISIWPYNTPKKRDERQGMIVAGQLSGNGPSGPGYLAWLAGKGFTQTQFDNSGLVVDVTDSGLDNGTTNINHFALFRGGTTADVARVKYVRLEGSANGGSTLQGCDGHGNLNAHIIGGHVTLSGSPHADSGGYRYGLGIAPFVRVGSSVIFDPSNFTGPDYDDLASRAYRDGARISGNSWGADTFGGYDMDAQNYDRLVRDAQPAGAAVESNGNQQLTFVFAAGNSGSGSQTVGSPGTAKNVITVGAAENVHSHATTNGGNNASGNDGCDTPDSEANSANDVAPFSSRGPCSDGRKKPDIMAPGTHVTGGVGQGIRTMSGIGTAVSCFNAEGVCALPGGGSSGDPDNFFPLGQQWYSTSSGTSHSTPAVAGGAALVHQWFINTDSNAPSPAMIKAFLLNAARHMNGAGANDSLLSNNQGMGMMDLGLSFDETPRLLRDQKTNELFTATGQSRTFTGSIVSNAKSFRVTLAWTDAPGATSGNAYKNNLDLTVTVNGQSYLGNVFSGAFSTTGGSSDTRNNVESVFLPAGTTGSVVISVSAANINSDGVPNHGGGLDQDFALAVYNFEEAQIPAIALAGTQIAVESCGAGNGALDPNETVTVKFALKNVGSADTTNVVATLLAGNGVSSPGAAQSYGALAQGGAAVTNAFTFTATGACGGTVTAILALDDGSNSLGAIAAPFTIGDIALATATNANASSIGIPDSGTASPYPSTINVSGLAGAMSKVRVVLAGFTHTYPSDLDIVVVGPGGQKVALFGGAGGSTAVSGQTLTFDDDASGPISGSATTGTYQPSGSVAAMPSPAPAAPYATALSEFAGTSPNGAWVLYVNDAAAGDSGSIAQGWRLEITAGEPVCCASNQPPVLDSVGNKFVVQGNSLTFAVNASDPYDGDPITLGASNLPPGAVFPTVTNAPAVTNVFLWTNTLTIGVYTTTFFAVDKDGSDSETIVIDVADGSCTGSNIVEQDFGASTNVPAGWVNGGTANDTDPAHYQSAPNCRALGTGDSLVTEPVDFPTQLVFFVDSSNGGNNKVGTVDYSTNGGSYVQLGGFAARTTGSNVTFALNASPNLSGATDVRFRFNSSFNTWYLDDVVLSGGCPPGPPAPTPPILNPIGAKNVTISNLLQFTVSATPTDADPVTLTASNLPSGAAFGATNENGWFQWDAAAPAGVYTTTFHAVDADGAVSEAVLITVSEQAPVSTGSLVTYIFEDTGAVFTRAADSVLAGATAGLFTSGDGVTTNFGGDPTWAIADSGFTGTTNNWFEFTLTLPGGTTVDVSRLKFADRRSGSGPSTWGIRSSVDGFVADLDSGATHLSFTTNEVPLALTGVSGALTIRIHGRSASQSAGTWRLDNVILLGSAGVPPPGGAPSIAITTTAQTVSNPTTSIAIGGTATTNVAGDIRWTNSLTGGSGAIAAATNWLIGTVGLAVGTNEITVWGSNTLGAATNDEVAIVRQGSDTDEDGLNDAWELGYFGSLTNINETSDWDLDGFRDGDEFLAGTSPDNSNSLLRLQAAAPAGPSNVVIRWQSASNRLYGVSRSTNLLEGFAPLTGGLPAIPPENVWTDPSPPAAGGHYRVDLE